MTAPVQVDFEEILCDPPAVLAKYRAMTPVIHNGANHYVLRAADVIALQKDRRLRSMEGAMMRHRGYPAEGNMWRLFTNTMLLSNGAVHARRRAPALDAFSRRMIAQLRAYIRGEARALAAQLPRDEDFDFVEAFAGPLPGRVIAHVVGLDPDRWETFARLVYEMTQGIAPPFPADRWDRIEGAAGEFIDHIAAVIADRRAAPRDDFVTAYVAAVDAAGEMDEEETLIQIVGIVLAGTDTTRGGITVTVGRLLEDRRLWEEVGADRDLIPAAVAEALRIDPPTGGSPRMTVEPLEVGGVTIPAGVPVDLLVASALRDPALYDRPDEFDLHRENLPRYHPVFGGGVHRCLGEQLALAELEEGLDALLDLAADMKLVGERKPLIGFTGVREVSPLIVRID